MGRERTSERKAVTGLSHTEVNWRVVSRYVPAEERVVFLARPHWLYVPLAPLVSVVLILAASVGIWKLHGAFADEVGRGDRALYANLHLWSSVAAGAGVLLVFLRLVWQTLEWRSRLYILTNKRIIRVAGVLRQHVADAPLRNVQHLTLYRSLRERVFGLGTVGINTSGTAFTEMFWLMQSRPQHVLAEIRRAADLVGAPSVGLGDAGAMRAASGGVPVGSGGGAAGRALAGAATQAASRLTSAVAETDRPVVVGLVGGIGAGKSAVANELEALGAVVIDSDKEARAALLRPEVRDQLVEWWGVGILTTGGLVDRKKVAQIVFGDESARLRLEGLIHPMLKRLRTETIEKSRGTATRLVVVDAPLLFEAGVDRECDYVVFVDAPYEQRLERVTVRGWDAVELDRREKAQLPLEEKRRRADDCLVNDGRRDHLSARVRDLLRRIQATVGSGRGSPRDSTGDPDAGPGRGPSQSGGPHRVISAFL